MPCTFLFRCILSLYPHSLSSCSHSPRPPPPSPPCCPPSTPSLSWTCCLTSPRTRLTSTSRPTSTSSRTLSLWAGRPKTPAAARVRPKSPAPPCPGWVCPCSASAGVCICPRCWTRTAASVCPVCRRTAPLCCSLPDCTVSCPSPLLPSCPPSCSSLPSSSPPASRWRCLCCWRCLWPCPCAIWSRKHWRASGRQRSRLRRVLQRKCSVTPPPKLTPDLPVPSSLSAYLLIATVCILSLFASIALLSPAPPSSARFSVWNAD